MSSQKGKTFLVHESRIEARPEFDERDEEKLVPPLFHSDDLNIWNERLVMIEDEEVKDHKNRHFVVLDLFMNKTRTVFLPSLGKQFLRFKVFPLTNNYGVFVESSPNAHYVRFVRLDLELGKFHIINQFQRKDVNVNVFVDRMEPSKFVLKYVKDLSGRSTYQTCELVDRKIKYVKQWESRNGRFSYYFDNRMTSFEEKKENYEIAILNFTTNEKKTVKLDFLPNNAVRFNNFNHRYFNDCFHIPVKFLDTNNYGVAWTNVTSNQWNFINFETKLCIQEINFFNDNYLVIRSESSNQINSRLAISEQTIQNVPVRRPDSFCNIAWLATVRSMKDKKKLDPYKEAAKRLPDNSKLRPLWTISDQQNKTKDPSKLKRGQQSYHQYGGSFLDSDEDLLESDDENAQAAKGLIDYYKRQFGY